MLFEFLPVEFVDNFIDWLPILMVIGLLGAIMSGYPVAFALAGISILFGFLGYYLNVFSLTDFSFVPMRIWGVMNNFTLVAVPLFVFMGIVLEKSGISEELLKAVTRLFRNGRSSMAISVILVGALLAASTGIVGATVITMGVLALPTMLENGYSKELASGTVASAGTLGQIIPPSIVLILLGDIMNVDVGDLFMGALMPGLLLVGLYILYTLVATQFKRHCQEPARAALDEETETFPISYFAKALFAPLMLILVVLGSILSGIASPTEAAACGVMGALIIALSKKRLNLKVLNECTEKATLITAMVFAILIGAQFFGIVFRGLYGDELITHWFQGLGGSPEIVLLISMLLLFVLGFFLDFIEICFVVVPILLPIFNNLGFDPLWVAILIAVNLQTSFLTPPFGFALFYLKGVAPPGMKTSHIYRGIIPFVFIQIFALFLIAIFPKITTWLPHTVFN